MKKTSQLQNRRILSQPNGWFVYFKLNLDSSNRNYSRIHPSRVVVSGRFVNRGGTGSTADPESLVKNNASRISISGRVSSNFAGFVLIKVPMRNPHRNSDRRGESALQLSPKSVGINVPEEKR